MTAALVQPNKETPMTTKSVLRQVLICASALLVLAAPGTAFAQAKPATERPIGGYLNAHFGVSWPSEGTFVSSGSENSGSTINEASATYPIGSGFAYEIGGGIVIKRRWIAGAAFSHTTSSEVGEFTLRFAHPPTHGLISDTVATDPLDRRESTVHIQGGVLVPMGRCELMLFGGPSHFSVSQQTLADIEASEIFTGGQWTVTISDITSETQSASAWGYNFGGDLSVKIAGGLSIGGQVRYSRATVSIEDAIASGITDSKVMKDMKVGGVQALGGVRFRF
jgi:hypothetical protein